MEDGPRTPQHDQTDQWAIERLTDAIMARLMPNAAGPTASLHGLARELDALQDALADLADRLGDQHDAAPQGPIALIASHRRRLQQAHQRLSARLPLTTAESALHEWTRPTRDNPLA